MLDLNPCMVHCTYMRRNVSHMQGPPIKTYLLCVVRVTALTASSLLWGRGGKENAVVVDEA